MRPTKYPQRHYSFKKKREFFLAMTIGYKRFMSSYFVERVNWFFRGIHVWKIGLLS